MTKKFGFLRFIAGFYKVVGVILAIAAVIGAVAVFVGSLAGGAMLGGMTDELGLQGLSQLGGVFGGLFSGLAVLIGLGISAICQFAISEAIMVFLAIEENTRATAGLLSRQA